MCDIPHNFRKKIDFVLLNRSRFLSLRVHKLLIISFVYVKFQILYMPLAICDAWFSVVLISIILFWMLLSCNMWFFVFWYMFLIWVLPFAHNNLGFNSMNLGWSPFWFIICFALFLISYSHAFVLECAAKSMISLVLFIFLV